MDTFPHQSWELIFEYLKKQEIHCILKKDNVTIFDKKYKPAPPKIPYLAGNDLFDVLNKINKMLTLYPGLRMLWDVLQFDLFEQYIETEIQQLRRLSIRTNLFSVPFPYIHTGNPLQSFFFHGYVSNYKFLNDLKDFGFPLLCPHILSHNAFIFYDKINCTPEERNIFSDTANELKAILTEKGIDLTEIHEFKQLPNTTKIFIYLGHSTPPLNTQNWQQHLVIEQNKPNPIPGKKIADTLAEKEIEFIFLATCRSAVPHFEDFSLVEGFAKTGANIIACQGRPDIKSASFMLTSFFQKIDHLQPIDLILHHCEQEHFKSFGHPSGFALFTQPSYDWRPLLLI